MVSPIFAASFAHDVDKNVQKLWTMWISMGIIIAILSFTKVNCGQVMSTTPGKGKK